MPADFWPSYSSFANTDGGVIILGVREKDGKREIEGMADTEKIHVVDVDGIFWSEVDTIEDYRRVLEHKGVRPL